MSAEPEYVAAARRWAEANNALAELRPTDSVETAERLAGEYVAASAEFERLLAARSTGEEA